MHKKNNIVRKHFHSIYESNTFLRSITESNEKRNVRKTDRLRLSNLHGTVKLKNVWKSNTLYRIPVPYYKKVPVSSQTPLNMLVYSDVALPERLKGKQSPSPWMKRTENPSKYIVNLSREIRDLWSFAFELKWRKRLNEL